MSIKYDLTAVEILKLLGYSNPIGKENLEIFEKKNNLKLPFCLFEFLSVVYDNPLFVTADIWTSLYFSYEDIEERIEDDKEYWEENPDGCAEDEYFKFSKIPKEKWADYVDNYLQIGSDYAAGVVVFGIRKKDLEQKNPPVYMLHEADAVADWKVIYDKLSDYLMAVTLDVLSCVNYHTAENILHKKGWNFCKYNGLEKSKECISDNNINISKMNKYTSLYGVAAVYTCCYDDEKQTFFIFKNDEDKYQLFVISKSV